jgi:hypothetical protein
MPESGENSPASAHDLDWLSRFVEESLLLFSEYELDHRSIIPANPNMCRDATETNSGAECGSCNQLVDHLGGFHPGQLLFQPQVVVAEPFVIVAEQVQDRRVEVTHMDRVFDDVV